MEQNIIGLAITSIIQTLALMVLFYKAIDAGWFDKKN